MTSSITGNLTDPHGIASVLLACPGCHGHRDHPNEGRTGEGRWISRTGVIARDRSASSLRISSRWLANSWMRTWIGSGASSGALLERVSALNAVHHFLRALVKA